MQRSSRFIVGRFHGAPSPLLPAVVVLFAFYLRVLEGLRAAIGPNASAMSADDRARPEPRHVGPSGRSDLVDASNRATVVEDLIVAEMLVDRRSKVSATERERHGERNPALGGAKGVAPIGGVRERTP